MADQDTDTDTLDADRIAEQLRQTSIRCFKVWVNGGQSEIVWGHQVDNTNPAGHLNFITVLATGRHLIRDSFACGVWLQFMEIADDGALATTKRNIH